MALFVFTALFVLALAAVEGAFVQQAHQTTAVQRAAAAGVVKDLINGEVTKALNLANAADAQVREGRNALAAAQQAAGGSRQLMNARSSAAEQLRSEISRLVSEKQSAEDAKNEAVKAASKVAQLEQQAAAKVEKAREHAVNAERLLSMRAAESRKADAAVRSAQESIDFIPAGFPQTRITVFDMQKLRQGAAFAKQQWNQAKADARMYHQALLQAQQHATQVWVDGSRAYEARRVQIEIFKAKCEALTNTQAAYAKARDELQFAKDAYAPKEAAVTSAEKYLAQKLERAGDYWAVYNAMVAVSKCAAGAQAAPSTGGSSSGQAGTVPTRQQGANTAGGGSSEENSGGAAQPVPRTIPVIQRQPVNKPPKTSRNRAAGGSASFRSWSANLRRMFTQQAAAAAAAANGSSSEED